MAHESEAMGMYKQQGGLPTEETRKFGKHDLNEFTVEDECVPSPEHISRNEEIVLPEVITNASSL